MVDHSLNSAINLRLALLGLPTAAGEEDSEAAELVAPVLARQRELSRRLSDRLSPVDLRIETFLHSYLGTDDSVRYLPRRTVVLDKVGLARGLSLPITGDVFTSPLLSSYRLRNGVLHNPANDRRTTQGVFHVVEGGMAIPDDKIAVPREAFAGLLKRAFEAPQDSLIVPFTANEPDPARCFISLLLRPLVVPSVGHFTNEKRMEIRFFAPGGLVSNLDFVEGIFGNGGDPYLPEHDASLDPISWSGHTGCVILAPHLTHVTKKELGLPHVSHATPRQVRDGMCWSKEDEPYNGGKAFKVCARDERGVIVTVIADNYYGYCKKEVKTQISYAANLFGSAEEEHSGGALCFPSYREGQEYTDKSAGDQYSLADVVAQNPDRFILQPAGYAIDAEWDHLILVPANAEYSMANQNVTWTNPNGTPGEVKLQAGKTYLGPNGFRIELKPLEADPKQWNLIGTAPRATACHKPATVSGGGKSEISKAITDAFIFGNVYVADFEADMAWVAEILNKNYTDRFVDPAEKSKDSRSVLSDRRSVGSVIKLLTKSSAYTDEYNLWLGSIPQHIKELVYAVKRYYVPEWGDDWLSHFSIGIINGRPGNVLRLNGERIVVNTVRVGFEADGSWRIFGLRHDFSPAVKVQLEDDITASVVSPGHLEGRADGRSRKYVENCEELLFQRPDDAIHRGYDKQAEADISSPGTFLSNFEPLTKQDAQTMVDDAVGLSAFTPPMRELIEAAAEGEPGYFVSSANPRIVNGAPSKNPRYLQRRPDLTHPKETAAARVATHLYRKVPLSQPLSQPVDIVAAGRRNNPAEAGVPPLCSYNPLHYMELPELFMEFISSMTGKSPSTTGAGSEGAMTKGPFNALPAIIDLNAAFVGFALTGYDGWLSSAGYVGPKVRVNHDVSLLIPELFSRMSEKERDAHALIAEGSLEKIEDFEHNGKLVLASRLGYRMTQNFAVKYFGRIFLYPDVVFTEEMLRPELQDADQFAESVAVIVATHQRVAQAYFDDGTVSLAVPPLRALLEIMAHGKSSEGWDLTSPEFREQFSFDSVIGADWYRARLDAKQGLDVARADRALAALDHFISSPNNAEVVERLAIADRLTTVKGWRDRWASAEYRDYIVGTLGRQVL